MSAMTKPPATAYLVRAALAKRGRDTLVRDLVDRARLLDGVFARAAKTIVGHHDSCLVFASNAHRPFASAEYCRTCEWAIDVYRMAAGLRAAMYDAWEPLFGEEMPGVVGRGISGWRVDCSWEEEDQEIASRALSEFRRSGFPMCAPGSRRPSRTRRRGTPQTKS